VTDDRLARHREFADLRDPAFVDLAYWFLVRRDPDGEGRKRALRQLREGTLSRATLLHELATSDEFALVRALDDGIAHAAWARRAGVRPRELPAALPESRLVEIPWVLSRYRGEPRVLDVGYAFAEPAYLVALTQLGAEELVGVDLAEAEVPGLTGVIGDLRELPFLPGSFDLVLAVSTLEHVGADTTRYGIEGERDPAGIPRALVELRRVLTDEGRLLVTLPLGEPGDFGWYVQHDLPEWERIFRETGFAVFEHEEYPELGLLCAELRPRRRFDRLLRRLGR
jgi:SAM-dependent methyltransferase